MTLADIGAIAQGAKMYVGFVECCAGWLLSVLGCWLATMWVELVWGE